MVESLHLSLGVEEGHLSQHEEEVEEEHLSFEELQHFLLDWLSEVEVEARRLLEEEQEDFL